jgi:NADH:ubiquinone oxidoreductase subunit 5 (subunit L)/multisubunit Na+/H+ antiporter MnhA subunit
VYESVFYSKERVYYAYMETSTQLAKEFVEKLNTIILFPTIALLSAVAVLVFMYGCFLYIVRAGEPSAREQGVKHITWGIIGMVVMLSAYTILNIAAGTFGFEDELDAANQGNIVIPPPSGGSGLDGTGNGSGGSSLDTTKNESEGSSIDATNNTSG